MDEYMRKSIDLAVESLNEGGIPIGSVLVLDGEIVGAGHNQRVQKNSCILHGEMDCLENAGRLTGKEYGRSVLYTTLSPCSMCSGAIILYKIPKVVIGENKTFRGDEKNLQKAGIEVEILQNSECIKLMEEFIKMHPNLWNEDIGL